MRILLVEMSRTALVHKIVWKVELSVGTAFKSEKYQDFLDDTVILGMG